MAGHVAVAGVNAELGINRATPPAMVAMPPVIIQSSSLRVYARDVGLDEPRLGRPMKMFAAAESVSLPLVRIAFRITHANAWTTFAKCPSDKTARQRRDDNEVPTTRIRENQIVLAPNRLPSKSPSASGPKRICSLRWKIE